jgi:hypothetical protein
MTSNNILLFVYSFGALEQGSGGLRREGAMGAKNWHQAEGKGGSGPRRAGGEGGTGAGTATTQVEGRGKGEEGWGKREGCGGREEAHGLSA